MIDIGEVRRAFIELTDIKPLKGDSGQKVVNAFRHYLTALREQVTSSRVATFEGTVALHNELITRAEKLLARLARNGVRGQDRDFANYIDVDHAAMVVFERARGARIKRSW